MIGLTPHGCEVITAETSLSVYPPSLNAAVPTDLQVKKTNPLTRHDTPSPLVKDSEPRIDGASPAADAEVASDTQHVGEVTEYIVRSLSRPSS